MFESLTRQRTPREWGNFAAQAAGVVVLLVLPFLGFTKNPEGFMPILVVVACLTYALFALGLNIVVGFAGLLDLGFVAFFLFGAYVGAWLMSDFAINVKGRDDVWDVSFHLFSRSPDGTKGIHLSFWIAVIVCAIVAAIAGVIIGWPTLKLKSDYLALVTLGFGEILPEVFRNSEKFPIGNYNLTNGTKGIGIVDPIGYGFGSITTGGDGRKRYYVILLFVALFAFISIRIRDGKLGRSWMAIREDELAASLMGVPLRRAKLWSYAVGAVAGGVGGALYATTVGTVDISQFTFQVSIIVLCAVILGGMGNVWGAILGAFVMVWVSDNGLKWFGRKIDVELTKYQFALFGFTLVLMMLFRPEGLLPAARSKQVKQADRLAAQGVES